MVIINFLRTKYQEADNESQLLVRCGLLSLGLHFFFFASYGVFSWISFSPYEELVIEAELGDLSNFDGMESALPKAKQAEEAAVPEKMLPQLPERMQKQDQGEMAADTGDKAVDVGDEKPKEISSTDLLRRQALEQLRKEEKFAKQLQAQKDKALADLRKSLASSGQGMNGFDQSLKRKVRTCYKLPQHYQANSARMKASTSMTLDQKGNVTRIEIIESSGDPVFDALIIEAVKQCSPYSGLPAHLAGKDFQLVFSP